MANPVNPNSDAFKTQERLRSFVGSSRRSSEVRALALDALSLLSDSPSSLQGTPHSQSARSPGLFSLRSFAESIDDSPSATPIQRNIYGPLRHSFKALFNLETFFLPQIDVIYPPEKKKQLINECLDLLEEYAEEIKTHVNGMLDGKERIRTQSPNLSSAIPVEMTVHELRTPLNCILGYLDLFKGDIENPQKYLPKLGAAYEHLLRLKPTILENVDSLELQNKPFSLRMLLESVLNITRAYDSRVNLKLDSEIDENLSLIGDSLKISQVLLNLISNAMKYSPKPGTVTITVKSKEEANKASVFFSVRDEGPGMSPDLQNRLFRPYSTGDRAQDSDKESTGLGLALSQKYIDLMGKKIQIQSELNKGSTFSFDLDFEKSNLKSTEIPKSPLPSLYASNDLKEKNIQILAADDDSPTRDLINRYFEMMKKDQKDTTFSIFADGEKAFEEYKRNTGYKVCVFDMNMGPGMTGWETGIKIHEFAKQMGLIPPQIIICCGQSESENKRLLESANVDFAKRVSFLEKPVKRVELIHKINQVVHHHRSQTASRT